jgi:hypothetical protein
LLKCNAERVAHLLPAHGEHHPPHAQPVPTRLSTGFGTLMVDTGAHRPSSDLLNHPRFAFGLEAACEAQPKAFKLKEVRAGVESLVASAIRRTRARRRWQSQIASDRSCSSMTNPMGRLRELADDAIAV